MNSKRIILNENGCIVSKGRRLNLFKKEGSFLINKASSNIIKSDSACESVFKQKKFTENKNNFQAENKSEIKNSDFQSKENNNAYIQFENFENFPAQKKPNTPNRPLVNPFLASLPRENYFLLKNKNLNYNEINAESTNGTFAQKNFNNYHNSFPNQIKENINKESNLNENSYRYAERSLYNEFIIADVNKIKNAMPDISQLKKITTVKISDIFSKNLRSNNSNPTEKSNFYLNNNTFNYKKCFKNDFFENKNSYAFNDNYHRNYYNYASLEINKSKNLSKENCFNLDFQIEEKNLNNTSTAANFGSKAYVSFNNFSEIDKENEIADNYDSLSIRSNLSTIQKAKSDLKLNKCSIKNLAENQQIFITPIKNNPFESTETAYTNSLNNNKNKNNVIEYLSETAISNISALASQNKNKKNFASKIKEDISNKALKEHIYYTPINIKNCKQMINQINLQAENCKVKTEKEAKENLSANSQNRNFDNSSFGKFEITKNSKSNAIGKIKQLFSEDFQKLNFVKEKQAEINTKKSFEANFKKVKNDFNHYLNIPGINYAESDILESKEEKIECLTDKNKITIENLKNIKAKINDSPFNLISENGELKNCLENKNNKNNKNEYKNKQNATFELSCESNLLENKEQNLFDKNAKSKFHLFSLSKQSQINSLEDSKFTKNNEISSADYCSYKNTCPTCKNYFADSNYQDDFCERKSCDCNYASDCSKNSSSSDDNFNRKSSVKSSCEVSFDKYPCDAKSFIDTKLKVYLNKKKAKKEIFKLQNNFENKNNNKNNQNMISDSNIEYKFYDEKRKAEDYSKELNINFTNLNKENNTDYVFKEFIPAKNFDKDFSEIENFALERNDYTDYDSDSQITHRLLPNFLRNDEAYKERLADFLRLPKHQQKIKTEKFRFGIKRKFSELAEIDFNGNVTRYYEMLGINRKKCVSLKKHFESFYSVEGEKGKMQVFRIFKDKEIGLDKLWQRQLKITEMDDDYMTDEEQLTAAARHIMKEISQGISSFKKNKNNCRNYKYVSKSKKYF